MKTYSGYDLGREKILFERVPACELFNHIPAGSKQSQGSRTVKEFKDGTEVITEIKGAVFKRCTDRILVTEDQQ